MSGDPSVAATVAPPSTDLALAEINLADPATWARPDIHGILAKRRAEAPVARDHHPSTGRPFWSLTRWDDVALVSRDTERFTVTHGVSASNDPGTPNVVADTMLALDPPTHTAVRKLVSGGFTPRQVRSMAPLVQRRIDAIIDELAAEPTDDEGFAHVDFVKRVAIRLPAAVICELMGIPEQDQDRMVDLTNKTLTPREFGIGREELPLILAELDAYGLELAADRIANPTDDLTSMLVTGQIADEPLAPNQIGALFRLLVLAGNETTRNALSNGLLTLLQWPDEAERWRQVARSASAEEADEFAWVASDEIVRWVSPVIHMKRETIEPVVLGDVEIPAGEKVVMWYPAANRDPAHFADAYRFDVTRQPNHHAGFGPGGPHFCLGASLARREIALMLSALLARFDDISLDGEAEWASSNFLNALTRLPVRFKPAA